MPHHQKLSFSFSLKKILRLLIIFSASLLSLIGYTENNYTYHYSKYAIQEPSLNKSFDTEWNFSSASKKGQFNWNIANDLTGKITPNILSELTYKDLSIAEGTSQFSIYKNHGALSGLMSETKLDVGSVLSGSAQDSDFNGDNRNDEYSRSIANLKGSSIVSATTAIGYRTHTNPYTEWRALLGYSFNEQNFIKREGREIISTDNSHPLAAYNNLDSQYNAQWQGPWLGGEWHWKQARHTLGVRAEQHWPDYYAQADWNLREELAHPKSFDQTAKGKGQVVQLSYSYALTQQLHLILQAHYEKWGAISGIDTLYFANGNSAQTRLNEANWSSQGFSLGITFQ